MDVSASKEVTGCVPEAPTSTFVQRTEMNHPISPYGLQMGVGINITKSTHYVLITPSAAQLTKGFMSSRREGPVKDRLVLMALAEHH